MKKIVYKSQAIQAVILLVTAVLLLSLWPLRIWNETITESIPQNTGAMTDVINDEYTILQSFVAQYDHMDTISLYLGDGTEGETITLEEPVLMIGTFSPAAMQAARKAQLRASRSGRP